MTAPIAQLRDDFADNTQAATWGGSFAIGSATKAETGGQARLTLPSATAGSHQAFYRSSGTYDLTGDGFVWNIDTMVATGVAALAAFDLFLDGSNLLRWRQLSNAITARTIVAGVDTQLFTATWNASTYKYLRIRESGGTIFFDSSTNGTSWTNRASVANPFAVTTLTVQFGASCGNIASPGSLRIEDVNLILPALATNWRWTQVVWPLKERFKVVTLALDTAATAQCYIAFADTIDVNGDPVTPTYWSGPATDGRTLTSQATQAAAQAMAVNIPVDGRFDLPTMQEGRVIRVYHRSIDGASYILREAYPRRLVQSDDIEAESIRTINLAAGAVTADKIFVVNLGAIVADIGKLNIDLTGYLYQGTGTGDAPTTGLKIFNSGGIGKLSTYNTGVEQVTLDTDGKLKAGAGAVQLDATGVTIDTPLLGAEASINMVRWKTGANAVVDMYGTRDPAYTGRLYAHQNGTDPGVISLIGQATGAFDNAEIQAKGATAANNGLISFNADLVYSFSGFSVGLSAGDAAPGFLRVQETGTFLKGVVPPRSGGTAVFAMDSTAIGSAFSLANNAVGQPFSNANVFGGLILINETLTFGAAGLFLTGGGVMSEISDPSTKYSTVAGTASMINVYLVGSVITIENKTGSSIQLNVCGFRNRTGN